MVGVNKYRIDKDNRDYVNGNRDGNEVGEDAADSLRIGNADVR